ncbi:MAG: endonuclease Q family protein [Patescibacteria group bacterium]|nr:endonuclease Q family protein [Patescibacteria group bacterium]MDD5294560.1 endonuclease Q family protein [Patescibacteria group bacterium]MDD5554657.1 endonuclease Q family protein [Patescibacteria group bacterium]
MRQILDLHIHSRYSRACSSQLNLSSIDATCRIKGIDIIATGDFTYPEWFFNIKSELEEIDNSGLYKLKEARDDKVNPAPFGNYAQGTKGAIAKWCGVKFLLSTELSLIYKDGERVRRIHIVVQAPNTAAVEELNNYLDKKYNIRSDGRPILGMKAPELVKLCLSIHPKFLIYPAHIWTPWFAVFGSKSGFDSMEECFHDETKNIYAIETGLSSDPAMNWRLSALDKLTILSNSDAHSLPNLGREANVMDLDEISYDEIYRVIKEKDLNKLKYTIEFYPEEGMYHFDGHRDCKIRFSPQETKKHKGICPVCKKPLTVGVMNRVNELADRPAFAEATAGKPVGLNPPAGQAKFIKLVELDKIIAEALNIKSRQSRQVQAEYNSLIKKVGSEMNILLNESLENLSKMTLPIIVKGIERVREGKLIVEPGFDGQYGTVKIFSAKEKEDKQCKLF